MKTYSLNFTEPQICLLFELLMQTFPSAPTRPALAQSILDQLKTVIETTVLSR